MRNTLLALALLAVLFSCKKNDGDPNTPASGELTSMHQYWPEVNTLTIDSLEFNSRHQLSHLKVISYSGAKGMSLPSSVDLTKNSLTTYGVFTFVYKGNDTLAAGYTLDAVNVGGVPGKKYTYGLLYDDQGRIVADSLVGGAGAGCMDYAFVINTHYSYTANSMVISQDRCDGSTQVDSFSLDNGNLTNGLTWIYNDPTNGSFHAGTATATYSSIESPFYKYKPLRSYFFGQILLSNEVLPVMSKHLETTYHVTYYAPTTGGLGRILQWQADEKDRAVSGTIRLDVEPSNTEYIQFYYAK